jgi:putative membrane protein insertion efficiency factor
MTEAPNGFARSARAVVRTLIRGYQLLISPLFPRTCRFHPTCSAYALTSVERFGVMRGGWLAVKRIARCNPFNPGGFDPVPDELHPSSTSTGRSAVH